MCAGILYIVTHIYGPSKLASHPNARLYIRIFTAAAQDKPSKSSLIHDQGSLRDDSATIRLNRWYIYIRRAAAAAAVGSRRAVSLAHKSSYISRSRSIEPSVSARALDFLIYFALLSHTLIILSLCLFVCWAESHISKRVDSREVYVCVRQIEECCVVYILLCIIFEKKVGKKFCYCKIVHFVIY